jgi:preprotein translocase subunit SecG
MLVAVLIIALVLLQRGKGADAGTGFGAGASATVFGARGSANFLSRMTAVLVTVFFVTSMSLAFLAGQTSAPSSLLEQAAGAESGVVVTPADGGELPTLPSSEAVPIAPADTDSEP